MSFNYSFKQLRQGCFGYLCILSFIFLPNHAVAKLVKVGVYSNKPLVFQDAQGEYQGLSIDVLRYVAEQEGWKLLFIPGTWPECLQRLEKNEIDLQVAIAFSSERTQKYNFPKTTLITGWGRLYKHPGTEAASFLDLDGKKVALLEQDIHARVLSGLLKQFNIHITPVYLKSYDDVLRQTEIGTVDLGTVNRMYAMQNAMNFKVETTPMIFNPTEIRYAASKKAEQTVLQAIDYHLQVLRVDKTSIYYQSLEKWFSQSHPGHISRWIIPALLSAGALLIIVIAVSMLLRRQVASTTKDLKKNRDRFRDMADMLPETIFETDKNMRITYANHRSFELFGYSSAELLGGMSAFDFITPENRGQVSKNMLRRQHGKLKSQAVEYLAQRKDGSTFPILVHMNAITDKGKPAGFRGVIIDISNRKEMEEHLVRSERKFRRLFEESPDAIFIVDTRSGRYLDANNAAEKLSGYNLTELTGMTTTQLTLQENQEQMGTVNASDNLTHLGDVVYVRPNGEQRLTRLTSVPLDKKTVFWIARDVTESRYLETSLKKSERRFKALHNASFGGIVIHDQGIILECNQGLANMTGHEVHELIGMNGMSLIAEKSRDMVLNNILSGYESSYEAVGIRKNGEEYPIRVEAKQIPYRDKEVRVVEFRDITVRKKMEKAQEKLQNQLIQSQKMEAIGTLAGGIAHDFNNILSAILGYSEMAKSQLPPDDTVGKDLEQIITAGNRATDLVKQILTFSRQNDEIIQPLAVQSVLKEALGLLRASLPTTIKLQEGIDKNCARVLADPTQIHQVVMNLCTNAKHAIGDEFGTLKVSLSEIKVPTTGSFSDCPQLTRGVYIDLEISDSGCGMDGVVLSKIFDPFFSTRQTGVGTGLGLAVAHGIIKQHKGEITVASKPDHGTMFHIYLPTIDEEARQTLQETTEEIPRGSERILFVDDEPVITEMMRRSLGSLGYVVTPFSNSVEALKAYQKNPDHFDLVITDMTMPEMTGIDLTKKLLAIQPDLPVILCTGFSEAIDKEKAKALGIREYVKKPVDQRTLAKAIRAAVTC
jgi:PAS domain S-box-containing protein